MCSPPSRTRSPSGPQAKGPGSLTSNRQVSASVDGSRAHARPSATNATVWVGSECRSAHPLGSGCPDARSAGTVGVPVGEPGPPGWVGTPLVAVDDVQAASTINEAARPVRSPPALTTAPIGQLYCRPPQCELG